MTTKTKLVIAAGTLAIAASAVLVSTRQPKAVPGTISDVQVYPPPPAASVQAVVPQVATPPAPSKPVVRPIPATDSMIGVPRIRPLISSFTATATTSTIPGLVTLAADPKVIFVRIGWPDRTWLNEPVPSAIANAVAASPSGWARAVDPTIGTFWAINDKVKLNQTTIQKVSVCIYDPAARFCELVYASKVPTSDVWHPVAFQ